MITISKKANVNYLAKIIKIDNIRKHPNADRLQIVTVDFQPIITGLEAKEGDLYVYFPAESKINHSFLARTNSYRHTNLNEIQDDNKPGFFEDNGRVKVIKLRGEKSSGYIVPLKEVENFTGEELSQYVGEEFDTIGDTLMLEKYIVHKRNSGEQNKYGKKPRISRLIDGQVHLHVDTEQLGKNMHKINPDDHISITYKYHGCVDKDSMIDTLEYGEKTIKEIVDNRLKCKIKTYNINTNKIEYKPITEYFHKENDGVWYEIELENNKKIIITGNNPVWLPELNCYRLVDELTIDDILLIS